MTPAGFADRYGPSARDQAQAIQYLRAHGLRVPRTCADRMPLDLAGSAGIVQSAVGVKLTG